MLLTDKCYTVSKINYESYEDIWKMFQNKLKINDKVRFLLWLVFFHLQITKNHQRKQALDSNLE